MSDETQRRLGERYIGDGVYASLDPGRMIILATDRPYAAPSIRTQRHWIALEPEVLRELIIYAVEIGWGALVSRALEIAASRGQRESD